MELQKEEFCKLTQGRKSVDEYSQEFTRLACYAEDEVSTDIKKRVRFRKGLNQRLRHEFNLIDFASFQVLVNMAIKVENGNSVFDESTECGFQTAPTTVQPMHQGHPSVHLVCLHRQCIPRTLVGSPVIWLPPVFGACYKCCQSVTTPWTVHRIGMLHLVLLQGVASTAVILCPGLSTPERLLLDMIQRHARYFPHHLNSRCCSF